MIAQCVFLVNGFLRLFSKLQRARRTGARGAGTGAGGHLGDEVVVDHFFVGHDLIP